MSAASAIAGVIDGRRIGRSMKTADWGRAERLLATLLDPEGPAPPMSIADAIAEFLRDCGARRLARRTLVSYGTTLAAFADHCRSHVYASMRSIRHPRVSIQSQSAARRSGGDLFDATELAINRSRSW